MIGTAEGNCIGDVMPSSHWLPIANRIRFKLCLLMDAEAKYQFFAAETIQISPLHGHRINQYARYLVLHTSLVTGRFSVAGPRKWNNLLSEVRNVSDISLFKRTIKKLSRVVYSD